MSHWPEVPVLRGRHVTLRPLQRADRNDLLAALSTGFERTFAGGLPTPETIDGWLDRVEAETAAGRAQVFAVLDANGAVAGTTRYMRMNAAARRVEIGTTLYAPRVRRTGLNTEAKKLLLGHAFDVLGVYCVQIRTDVLNHTSRRAIERIGAKQDGILRGHTVMHDPDYGDRRRDTVVYSILDIEWPGIRRHLDALLDR
ncbi:GNAT family N-acetyltransferase [Novosphingobium humi]|uniref:GNAT family N-acetyltransferase n=1 Tax=Novosphingobium humi TaxID=2282397 RepID=UPI0025AFB3E7|nr:GNAT family protein [Novosphingobium humi]WJS97492.1 GNAT family N-acetyltransferase [Novosphingobium humi]